MAEEMDYPPDKIVRMVQLGLKETALRVGLYGCVQAAVACFRPMP